MYENRPIRGDYFMDRLGGCTAAVLAGAGLGIVLFNPKQPGTPASHAILAALYGVEIVGAMMVARSKLPLMRLALLIFALRVVAGVAFMGVFHGDKLARSTLGFPILVAIYCFARVRSLRANP